MLNRAEERFAIFNGKIYFFKPVIIVAILYQTNINIATLKYGLPHRKDKQNQNRMENISSQKRTQNTKGASLVLVIHIGELLCSFFTILEDWNLVYSSCSEKDLNRWENNRNWRKKKKTTNTSPSGKALGTAFAQPRKEQIEQVM